MEDLEENSGTDWNITRMNAAGVISIFILVVKGSKNYKPAPSNLLSVSKARRERAEAKEK